MELLKLLDELVLLGGLHGAVALPCQFFVLCSLTLESADFLLDSLAVLLHELPNSLALVLGRIGSFSSK